MKTANEVLKKYWGFDDFRSNQKQGIDILTSGKDIVYVAATGDGKSLCYQVPALMEDTGVTIVISPLIALMQDQVKNLKKHGVDSAIYLNSSLSEEEYKENFKMLMNGEVSLLYISPEKLESDSFRIQLGKLKINYLIIDEFDSINEYGNSGFRPSYLNLGKAKKELERLSGRKIITGAFTATATSEMQHQAIENLNMADDTEIVVGKVIRENLSIEVMQFRSLADKDDYLYEEMKAIRSQFRKKPGGCIIFCTSVKDTEEIFKWLKKKNFNIVMYHGTMNTNKKNASMKKFVSGLADFVVCTNAFGRGVDKADIRYVYHYGVPGSITAYTQEIGRAGRDGKEADVSMLYYGRDTNTRRYMTQRVPRQKREYEKFKKHILENKDVCYIRKIKEHFGAVVNEDCGKCQICKEKEQFNK